MRIGFDVGGVLSKDKRWRELAKDLKDYCNYEIFIITDMHPLDKIREILDNNGLSWIRNNYIYSANYAKHGEACKAILLKQLKIDIFFDDFVGYLQWDSQLGPAPLRCLVMPNWNKPYWSEDWKCEGEDFGRRIAPENLNDNI